MVRSKAIHIHNGGSILYHGNPNKQPWSWLMVGYGVSEVDMALEKRQLHILSPSLQEWQYKRSRRLNMLIHYQSHIPLLKNAFLLK